MKKITYLVGGAVRDTLMGIEPKDLDWVIVGATERDLLSQGYKKVGNDFPVFLDPDTGDEVALPRKERSTGGGYNDFVCETEGVTLKEDLSRRDLTINAMAMTKDGQVIDYFGGQRDLTLKILRHTTDAFLEDPVRVLRLARFSARYHDFTIHADTEKLCRKADLSSLTPERVFKEIEKAFDEKNSHLFFVRLREIGVLGKIFPEIDVMCDIQHNNDHHLEGSVFNHTMMALKMADRMHLSSVEKFAVLLHDIGKPAVYKANGNMHGHDGADLCTKLVTDFCVKYRVPNAFKKAALQASIHHHHIHKWDEMKKSTRIKTMFKKTFPKTGVELKHLLNVAAADAFGRVERKSLSEKAEDLRIYLQFFDRLYLTGKVAVRADILDSFVKAKAISAKDFMQKNPDASVDSIKNYLNHARIAAI